MLKLDSVSLYHQNIPLLQNISLQLNPGEAVLITGASGSGKTLLGKIISGNIAPTEGTRTVSPGFSISFVHQQHTFNPSVSARSYYQQRYDSNYGNLYPTVEEYLLKDFRNRAEEIFSLLKKFSLEYILSRQLIQLSNGEGKRLQLVLALIQHPQLLILDNPLVGIDKENRKFLLEMLQQLSAEGMAYILIASSVSQLPSAIAKVITLEKGKIISEETPESFLQKQEIKKSLSAEEYFNWEKIDEYLFEKEDARFDIVIAMNDVTVTFGENKVLDSINWEVKRGERWLIRGANGSGKSMLLSLINGDNPKAFGQHIILFDKLKGSGESIWDLKKKIGFVSPEMHLHFLRRPEHIAELVERKDTLEDPYTPTTSALEVVASGFADQVGFGTFTDLQKKMVRNWLEFLKLDAEANTPFYQLPPGQQRLLLLARALVKNPPLLILDEPCQGLDDEQTSMFKRMVDHVCLRFNKTLLYVSHYDQDVPECVTKLLVLEKGKILV